MHRTIRDIRHWLLNDTRDRWRRDRRPTVEGLEERSLMSVAPAAAVHHHVADGHHSDMRVHIGHGPDAYGSPGPARGHHPFAHGRAGGGPNAYQQTNLVSDFPVGVEGVNPQISDPSLLNPWGLTASSTSPFWVSDQVTGLSTLYSVSATDTVTKLPITVTIPSTVVQPSQGFTPLTGPTGIVFNSSTTDFMLPGPNGPVPSVFIFSTLAGTLAGWSPASTGGLSTAVVVASKAPAEEFTGLAMGSSGGQNYLYTADPRLVPGIDVFNSSFQQVSLAGNFVDPKLPAGMSPYGIQDLNGQLFVTYIAPAGGGGVVGEFNTDGTFVRQIGASGSRGPLQGPWGAAIAPANFGHFSNDLLVGDFYDGRINAFNLKNGRFMGQLADPQGNPIVIPFLWGLDFGNGQKAGPTNTLFFTAGIAGQYHGLFGSIQATHRAR